MRWKKLPYFHMVDCAHGNGPFKNLTKDERIVVATRMIEIIKSYAFQGIAVTVNAAEFDAVMLRYPAIKDVYKTAYAFCAHTILAGVSAWIGANPRVAHMAYFFEAGHESAPQADYIMHQMFQQPPLRAEFRYVGHEFVEKKESAAVQAADLLAWQWFTDKRHQMEGRPRQIGRAHV